MGEKMSHAGEVRERLMHLCSLAAAETDPVRLSKLVHEIRELLEGQQLRLKVNPPEAADPRPSASMDF